MSYNRNRNRNRSRSGTSQNNQNSQNNQRNNQSSKGKRNSNSGRSNNKTNEFKFQLHDGGNRKAYTYEKIREAVILKIQTDFNSARYVVTSLWKRNKQGQKLIA